MEMWAVKWQPNVLHFALPPDTNIPKLSQIVSLFRSVKFHSIYPDARSLTTSFSSEWHMVPFYLTIFEIKHEIKH